MARAEARSLRHYADSAPADQFLFDRAARLPVADLAGATSLGGGACELNGRSVLIAPAGQLAAALAMIELDGRARRITILPPDADAAHLAAIVAEAEIDAVVVDEETSRERGGDIPLRVVCSPHLIPDGSAAPAKLSTEWVLLTSGTTGVPKLVVHSLAGLTAAIDARRSAGRIVWSTFYDIRRYGGLQIFLRAILGGSSLVLSSAGEPIGEHLERLARHAVTHLSGTPSHWRRALMSRAPEKMSPRYVRLSGEIADQAILDRLRAAFSPAAIGHAYASTEAGVGFAVDDGLAGFPAAFLEACGNGVELKVADGTLRVRSPGCGLRYLGTRGGALRDQDGFVDTGDVVERHGERYFFAGRKGGIINIGGLKVHPEEIEAVINRHPQVRMSLVRPKRNPVTGAIVIAEVVLEPSCEPGHEGEVRDDILKLCRDALARHKVPVAISFVPALGVAATGKLARRNEMAAP